MSTTTVYNIKVYCQDALSALHTHNVWQETTSVTACPQGIVDHTVLESEVISQISQTIRIIQDDVSETNGIFRVKGFTFDVAAGPDTDFQIIGEQSYPYNVRLYVFTARPSTENIGDTFSFVSARNTPIGFLMAPVSSGKVITVSDSVLVHLKVGFEVTLTNGIVSQVLGECYAIDLVAKTVTVEKDITESFIPGNIVMLTIKRIENILITNTNNMTFGSNTLGSSLAPAGIKGNILYKNASGSAKKFSIDVETSY